MATVEEAGEALARLFTRLESVDERARERLPEHRTIEVRLPDLELTRYVSWDRGRVSPLESADAGSDIRIAVGSDDLVAIADGELTLSRAYASGRLRLRAPMADLLRLRAAL